LHTWNVLPFPLSAKREHIPGVQSKNSIHEFIDKGF